MKTKENYKYDIKSISDDCTDSVETRGLLKLWKKTYKRHLVIWVIQTLWVDIGNYAT